MSLVTIADLDQAPDVKAQFISHAMLLGNWYHEFKKQDSGPYSYTIINHGVSERSAGIHASEISKCFRLLVYSIRGEERRSTKSDKADANMQMRFDLGNAAHAMLQSDLKRMCEWLTTERVVWITFEDEVAISPELEGVAREWNLHSHCDGRFTFWAADPQNPTNALAYLRVGLEIKTKSGPEYEKLTKPDAEHLEQTCLYMAALDVPLMWLLYYNKSNCNWTAPTPPYLYQFDKHLWEHKLETRFAKAHHLAERGELPKREEGRHCRWCPYTWTCQPPSLNVKRGFGPAAIQNQSSLRRIGKP